MTPNTSINNSSKYSFRVSERSYTSEEERQRQNAVALKKLTNVIYTDVSETDKRKGAAV